MSNGMKIYNHDATFESEVIHNGDVDFNGNKAIDVDAIGLVINGDITFPVARKIGELYYYSGSAGAGAGMAEYKGDAGTDYPGVNNSAGWYRIGKNFDDGTFVKRDGSRSFTGAIVGVNATTDNQLATLGQIKAMIADHKYIHVKAVITKKDYVLSGSPGLQDADNIQLLSGDEVLVYDQDADPAQNGIWVVNASGIWVRSTKAGSWDQLVSALIIVQKGDMYGDTIWISTVDPGGTLGVTPVNISLYPTVGEYDAENINADSPTYYNLYKEKVNRVFKFKSLRAGTGVVLSNVPNDSSVAISLDTTILNDVPRKRVYNFPATTANQTASITHDLNTPYLVVQVRRETTNDYVEFDIETTDTYIQITPKTNIPAGEYKVIVIG